MLDLSQIAREWLECRARAHRWDHGPAPIQVDKTQKPTVWVTRGRCPSCGMRRWRYMVPQTCVRITRNWEYDDPGGFRRAMHLVTPLDADIELARRDNVGGDEVSARRAAKAG